MDTVYACLIDYEKAFDWVKYEILIKCLKDIGINGREIKLIVNLYWSQRAYIQMKQGLSDEIMMNVEFVKDVCCHRVF